MSRSLSLVAAGGVIADGVVCIEVMVGDKSNGLEVLDWVRNGSQKEKCHFQSLYPTCLRIAPRAMTTEDPLDAAADASAPRTWRCITLHINMFST